LSVPISTVAGAIEAGEEKTLMSLEGVGKRMAQQIIAELKGKLQSFAAGAELPRREKRNEAMELIELACERHPDVDSAEELVPLVYRLKQGIEV
jgi:Holliday junction resolvasome RuvABC DNA-binding subunit